jgi:hypothetical protein
VSPRWLSFNVQEGLLHGLTVGAIVDVAPPAVQEATPAVVTEFLPVVQSSKFEFANRCA